MKNILKIGFAIAVMAVTFTGCKDKDDPKVIPTFNPQIATVQEGSSTTVTVATGKSPFTLSGANESIAEVSVSGSTITVSGKSDGSTSVTVTGSDGGSSVLGISVTKMSATTPTLSTPLVELAEDATGTVTISGGTPAFTATSEHPHIAGVSVSGTTVSVTANSVGTTTVTVKGSDNESASFVVNVTGERIFFGPTNTQIGDGKKSFYITESHTIKKGVYTMCGWIYVADGAELTIEPGTIIKCSDYNYDGVKSASGTSLIIKMGGKIYAEGTPEEPIVFTSAMPKGQRQATDWGGIILLGRAKNNQGTMMIEGGVDAAHGGDDDDDDSGIMSYCRLEFGGYPYALDNEINGLTFGSVGRGTTIDHIQVSYCGDDSFEWFGGSVNCKYLVAYHGWDDEFDTDNGFSGKMQFLLSVRDPKIGDQSNSNGFESDNNATGSTQTPFTTAVFSNVTIIGPMGQDPNFNNYDILFNPSSLPVGLTPYITGYNWGTSTGAAFPIRTGIFQAAMQIRRNSRMSCFNSVLTGYPVGLMIVPGNASSGNTTNYGQGSHEAAENGDFKIMNTFFAGMGMTGADVDSKSHAWVGLGPAGYNYSANYFVRPALNNTLYEPADDSYESIVASIELLKFKKFQSKLLPVPATGIAPNDPAADWRPVAGSPLIGGGDFTDALLNDPFFTPVDYAGAFADENDDWMEGWTNFDPQNTDY